MKYINKYLRNFIPYKVASHKIWTVDINERQNILKLDWNEATIPPSPNVGDRIRKIANGPQFYNLYPATLNIELLDLLSRYVELPIDNIQYFAGSDSLHEYISKLYITVGDPVLLLGPTYDNFRLTAEVCGADIYYYNLDDTFTFNAQAFTEKIDAVEPSLIYICNPNNPTGTLHNVDFIESLLKKYPQILFLIDEAYAEFSGISCKHLVLKYENILISRTMSKAFALANFRFGYLIASKNNIEYISSIRNPKNITTFTQEAVLGALSDIPYMQNFVKEVNKAAKQFRVDMAEIQGLKCIQGSGNFVLLQLYDVNHKPLLIKYLSDHNIYVRDISQTDFISKYCIRITIGTCIQMKIVADVIDHFFKETIHGKNSTL